MTNYHLSFDGPVCLGITHESDCDQYKIANMNKHGAAVHGGFQIGDIVLAVNGLAISNAHHFHKVDEIWNGASSGDRIRFSIDRQGVLIEFFVEVSFNHEQFIQASSK